MSWGRLISIYEHEKLSCEARELKLLISNVTLIYNLG